LFFNGIDAIDIFRIGIKTVLRGFIAHPVKRWHETGYSKRQSENAGEGLRFVFPQIAEKDFEVMCYHF